MIKEMNRSVGFMKVNMIKVIMDMDDWLYRKMDNSKNAIKGNGSTIEKMEWGHFLTLKAWLYIKDNLNMISVKG